MKKISVYLAGAALAGAAVLCFFGGIVTATKHNFVPAQGNFTKPK